MKTIAIIPARGGSKRLPRKNVLKLNGQPMLSYPIRTAKASGLFDEVYVSTEDAEIADVARQFGAEVIERPVQISEDRSTVVEVCLHALEVLPNVELMCCIYATAVLLTPNTLGASRALLDQKPEANFVMGVSEYMHPPVQALVADECGYLSYMWSEWSGMQSQFYPHLLVSNGTHYWARREALMQEKTFYGHRLVGHVVPEEEVSDINTQVDFDRVSAKIRFIADYREKRL